ncbi:DUF58 domain-containing protein [Thiomicrorhabdus sp. ZW0627]|uniref:DUF58 domain-containing protein n=1 Tax=Thiomicrorhabdus sp. ZW0627 TaxID=3039774 RepID=UPI002436BB97|nr:DUF58 domain-containing protein [Thiomicrorhabdus sp. ZW0627]MDG6774185.1 DUF58 domain-containing protein [Thiomicrorhabdus sp. ZW0627]
MSVIRLVKVGLQGLFKQLESSVDAGKRVQQPLLSADQIHALAEEVSHMAVRLSRNPRQSEALRQGEQTSRFMGAGLEYEESRPYQLGDEIRRINWRLMARTGQAYTKLFQEERQENWFILVDQRQSMRFGTKTRLKAEQALRAAGYYLWMAQQSGIPVEGARLAEDLQATPTFEGRGTFEHLMEIFSQPCPPQSQKRQEPNLNDVLLEVTQRIQPGSRVIIISDFHDVDSKTMTILTALQALARVKAVFIEDVAERELPSREGLRLQSVSTAEVFSLQGRQQAEEYRVWAESYFQTLENRLKQSGTVVTTLLAHEPLSKLAEQMEGVNG